MELVSGTKKRLLLVQVRRSGDPLLGHEESCVRKRLQCCSVDVESRNAAVERVEPSWLDSFDFVVVGGSGDFSAHDPRSIECVTGIRRLFDAALSRDMPGFGICFGHQVLGMHFGAEVRTGEEGAEAGTVGISLTEQGKLDPLTGTLDMTFGAHTGHSDYVVNVPQGLQLLGSSPHLATQMFRVEGAPFYSTQFHPDLLANEARYRYELFIQGLKPHLSKKASQTVKFDPEQDEIAMLLARFVGLFADEADKIVNIDK